MTMGRMYRSGWKMFSVCTLAAALLAGCGGSSETRSSGWLGVPGDQLAGVDATLTVVPSASAVTVGKPLILVALVEDKYGHPAADGTTLEFATRLGSTIESGSNASTKGGVFQTVVTAANTAGVEAISVSTPHVFATATFEIVAQPQPVTRVTVSPVRDRVAPGGGLPIVVFVKNESGVALTETVTMFSPAGGTFEPASGKTDEGVFVTTYTASTAQGLDWVTAIANGQVGSTTVAVKP